MTKAATSREHFKARRCALAHVEAVEARSSHAYPRHTHDSYGIGLIVSGAQRSWSGRGTVEAGRGNLITCNPGEVHDGSPIGDERAWRMLYLAPKLVASLGEDVRGAARPEFEFTHPVLEARGEHAQRFESAYAAMTTPGSPPALAEERILLLFAGLLARKARSTARTFGIARAKALIDDDPTHTITLAALSRETGLTRYQVVRAFTKETGLTPHAYIVQRRLCVARTMIARLVPLIDVANACGFADQSHFHRHFTRVYGMTPGVYAAALR